MTNYFVYDSNHINYNVYDVEKIMNSNINPSDNYNISLYCSICNQQIYFREATSKRKAQLCHYKNEKCIERRKTNQIKPPLLQ